MAHSLRVFGKLGVAVAAAFSLATVTVSAQELESIDPDNAYDTQIDGDLVAPPAATKEVQTVSENAGHEAIAFGSAAQGAEPNPATSAATPVENAAVEQAEAATATAQADSTTYAEDDLIGAAEGVFGKGAEGLAGLIEDLLKKQGEPNGYIVGREGGGALGIGVRYGSGTLYHKVEGKRPVYWTGPSIGFDAGANAGNTFVLVYNLYDTEELYKRFPAGEGQAYLVGGMHASYMRKGDIVLIPIRVGAGLRLGVNAGYMKFSKKQRWLPF
ncbi:MAG: DUF1134 domain-containing protein [Sphingomonadales bacterium]|nr:MAG: DUF1134 domain-containing protein [Sphingomonadales bacterium]